LLRLSTFVANNSHKNCWNQVNSVDLSKFRTQKLLKSS
jgi:hypothetical protein